MTATGKAEVIALVLDEPSFGSSVGYHGWSDSGSLGWQF